jgi:hypothetical protein
MVKMQFGADSAGFIHKEDVSVVTGERQRERIISNYPKTFIF